MTAAVKAVKAVRIPKAHSVSVASKVRYLANEKEMPRAEIARQLGIRYQRVRNILVPKAAKAEVESTEATEATDIDLVGTEIEPQAEELTEAAS
jgi:predicted transcriptional regulator